MSRLRLLSLLAVLALAGSLLLAACGGDDDDAGAASTAETTASVCTKDALQTKTAGTLTVATDSPAFPPYVIDDDPTNGKGFESAVAYAIADQLGFTTDEVKWIRVPFNSTFAPGPKKYDFDVNQVSINPQARSRAPTSRRRTTRPRRACWWPATPTSPSATSLADLKDAQIGVQVGTTSLDAVNEVIAPSKQPRVLRHVHRRRPGAEERAGGRDRHRPPDRHLPPRRRGGGLQDRRPVRARRAATTGAPCSRRAPR